MLNRTLLLACSLVLVTIAGCSGGPASGDLAAVASGVMADGTSENTYQAYEQGEPLGAVGDVAEPLADTVDCLLDPAAEAGVPIITACVDPYTNIKAHFMGLPVPDSAGYKIFLAGGSGGSRDLGAIMADAAGMWQLDANVTEDLTGMFERVELRSGSFVFATAPATAGTQQFKVAENATGVTAVGTYKGKVLTIDVSGLPEGTVYTGRLYTADEDGVVAAEASETFPGLKNGANEITATEAIDSYAQFHIHVGGSKINLYKANIV